jgi:hypothetical protein
VAGPDLGEHPDPKAARRHYREHHGQRPVLLANPRLEFPAARTQHQMPPERSPAELAPPGHGQVLADLDTRRRPGRPVGEEGRAGLVDEGLHLPGPAPEDLGDLRVTPILELGQEERAPLVLGQPAQIPDQLPKILPPGDLVAQAVDYRGLGLERDHRAALGGHAPAAVPGDGVEPRSELPRGRPPDQGPVGPDERLL